MNDLTHREILLLEALAYADGWIQEVNLPGKPRGEREGYVSKVVDRFTTTEQATADES